jgi:hypothetical protein
MPIDLNFRRRRHEREIAQEVAKALLLSADVAADPNAIGLRVMSVFETLGLKPDQHSAGRILRYANDEILRLRRGLDQAVSQMESAK